MTRMQVYLPDEMFVDLKQVALLQNTNMSFLIRKGLKKVLYSEKDFKFNPMRDFVGKGKAKRKTNAVSEIKDYYKNL